MEAARSCRLVSGYRHFWETRLLYLRSEYRNYMFLRNIRVRQKVYTLSKARSSQCEHLPPRECRSFVTNIVAVDIITVTLRSVGQSAAQMLVWFPRSTVWHLRLNGCSKAGGASETANLCAGEDNSQSEGTSTSALGVWELYSMAAFASVEHPQYPLAK